MHVHSTNTSPQQTVARMNALNLRYLFVSSLAADLRSWTAALSPATFLPALVLPCDAGRAPITGRPCWEGTDIFPDTTWLRQELQSGRIKGLGELSPQYLGMSPNDARLEPYWRIAEEFDVPVGVHMGPGPPGAAYDSNRAPLKSPNLSMAASDPLLLEEVLLRHKGLRLFVMHAGWPRRDSMLALLYAHPHVYVDVAALQAPYVMPRSGYAGYLRDLVDSGFSRRIMFGSDFPDQVEAGIDAIQSAAFLSADQKSDILCRNAARFLRLDASTCNP
jgi:predicted TIM-barrel fold metal-dependent hydrolase